MEQRSEMSSGGSRARRPWGRWMLSGGAAVGAVGGAAAFNALARRRSHVLDDVAGDEARTFEWRGREVAYTVTGSGSPVLLVHAIHAAAWSYEWRRVVAPLARAHTVYTIDLLGFGRSARPGMRYSPALYQALLLDFQRQIVGAPTTLVASSLSAAYAIALGARDPGRFPALVLVAPTGIARLNQRRPGLLDEIARLAIEIPIAGTALFNVMATRASLRRFLEQCYADRGRVTDALVDAYHAAAHQPGAKHAPAGFLAHHLDYDVRDPLRRLVSRTLIVWGERARIAPVEEVRAFMAARPDAEVAILEHAGDLAHDERPAEFAELVTGFVARLDQPVASGPRVPQRVA